MGLFRYMFGNSSLSGALGALLLPAIVGAIILLLIQNDNRKRAQEKNKASDSYTNSNVADLVTQPTSKPAPKPKQKNPYAGINAMLLAGSTLLVVAIIMFTHNANDSLVAPVAICLTLFFYILGIFIYKKINYLKIVGVAFTYISLAIFPFWVISFNFFGMSWRGAWILASIISFLAFMTTAFIYKSKIPVYFAYIWLFVIAWSMTPEGKVSDSGINAQAYWLYTSSAVVAMIPAILWKLKPNWLPVYFRLPTKEFAGGFMPTVMLFTISLYIIPDSIIYFPFLRTILCALFLAWLIIHWSINRSYNLFIFTRFIAQGLLLTVTMDALNYSLFASTLHRPDDMAQLVIITVWLLSFLAQTMLSLFIPKADKEIEKAEHRAEVCSLVGIFITPILTYDLVDPVGATVRLIICFVIAALGISYTIVHKDARWSIATAASLLLGRLAIMDSLLAKGWSAWSDIIYFTIIGGIIILMYHFFRKYNEKDMFAITMTEMVICLLLIVYSAADAGYAEIGWLISALYLALIGYLGSKLILYELSIYCGALCLYSLVGTVGDFLLPESAMSCVNNSFPVMKPCHTEAASLYTNWIAAINVIRSFIIGGALTAVSLIKERDLDEKDRGRFFLGYILMSIGLYAVGVTAGGHWMAFCLATQVAYLIYAALNDIEWLVWVTIIAMPICALSLTGGFTYIWFGILGLILIDVVIWRLTKINRARLRAEAKSDDKPVANKDAK